MFGKLGAPAQQGFSSTQISAPRDVVEFELDLGKSLKTLFGGLFFLAVGGWLLYDQLAYLNEGLQGFRLFLAGISLVLAVVCVFTFIFDMSSKGEVLLRLSSTGLMVHGWEDEVRWSEISDFSLITQKVNGVSAAKHVQAITASEVMARVRPGFFQAIGRGINTLFGFPGLRLPVNKIAGDVEATGKLVVAHWLKYRQR